MGSSLILRRLVLDVIVEVLKRHIVNLLICQLTLLILPLAIPLFLADRHLWGCLLPHILILLIRVLVIVILLLGTFLVALVCARAWTLRRGTPDLLRHSTSLIRLLRLWLLRLLISRRAFLWLRLWLLLILLLLHLLLGLPPGGLRGRICCRASSLCLSQLLALLLPFGL